MITRENYQEFFLLYVDNELSAADASALEEWVAANPDLMEEWESLQFCRVDPDEKVIFPGKEGLLRAGDDGIAGIGEDEVEGIGEDRVERIGEDRVAGIGEDGLLWEASPTSAGGYPGYLLSYIDGELGPAEREQAEARIAARASDAAELQQLLMTVSKPDISVIFPDKSSLYRKEKDRRVIELRRSVVPRPFPFVPFGPSVPSGILRAVAGAAAVILIAVPLLIKKPAHPVTPGGAVALQDKKAGGQQREANSQDPGVVREPQIQRGSQTQNDPKVIAKIQDTRSMREAGVRQEAGARREARVRRDPGLRPETGLRRETGIRRDPGAKREPGSQREPQMQRDLQGRREAPVSHEPRPATGVAETAAPPDQAAEAKSTGMAIAARQVDIPKDQSSFATQALLREDDEKALATANQPAPPGKSKLRGFFRKVTRTFGSTAERDGDGRREVLISAFQVAVN